MTPEREAIEQRLAEVKRSLSARWGEIEARVDRAQRTLAIRRHIREHLGLAVGVATTLGFLLGRRAPRSRMLVAAPSASMIPAPARPRGAVGVLVDSLLRAVITNAVGAIAASVMVERARDDEGMGEGVASSVGQRSVTEAQDRRDRA
jgi:hypothetical protein